jgi:hypothetical protein
MAKIMTIGKYPPHKFKDLMKVYMSSDKPAYPDFVKKIHNWAAQSRGGKYKAYAVYECPDDKLLDAVKAIAKRYHFYAQNEGYEYKLELLSEAEDAIKSLTSK